MCVCVCVFLYKLFGGKLFVYVCKLRTHLSMNEFDDGLVPECMHRVKLLPRGFVRGRRKVHGQQQS